MAENSAIQWTDHTGSPWYGCEHRVLEDGTAHPGCEHCYAETMAKRNPGTLGVWGNGGVRVRSKSFIANLRKWDREAKAAGKIVSVFPSMCDPFEDWQGEIRDSQGGILHRCRAGHLQSLDAVFAHGAECQSGCNRAAHPLTLDDLRREMFQAIDECPNVRLLLLTKRPENVPRMWLTRAGENAESVSVWSHRHNVAIGTSVSDQKTTDELVPKLLACRDLAPVLFLSYEPAIGSVDLTQIGNSTCGIRRSNGKLYPLLRYNALAGHEDPCLCEGAESHGAIDWVICGGESGHQARPMHGQWPRDVRDQCAAAGVPFFFKQWGEWLPISDAPIAVMQAADRYQQTGVLRSGASGDQVTKELCDAQDDLPELCYRVGKHAAGRLLDDREWNELPAAFNAAEAAR